MGNHWSDDGDLVIEDRTLFRQVGWQGHSGRFYNIGDILDEPSGYSPVYEQIATDHGDGWED
ncbi:MAG: hypothetical protein LC750_07620 [Actinobacteria bacterium]|nr:hypothetical protein [Actinomycetota bacterium]